VMGRIVRIALSVLKEQSGRSAQSVLSGPNVRNVPSGLSAPSVRKELSVLNAQNVLSAVSVVPASRTMMRLATSVCPASRRRSLASMCRKKAIRLTLRLIRPQQWKRHRSSRVVAVALVRLKLLSKHSDHANIRGGRKLASLNKEHGSSRDHAPFLFLAIAAGGGLWCLGSGV
jgi:hypothetical protein